MSYLEELRKKRTAVDSEFEAIATIDSFLTELVKLRHKKGLSQGDVAKASGLSQPHVSKIERLETDRIAFETVLRYADAVGATFKVTKKPNKKVS